MDLSGLQISEDLLFGGTVAPGLVVGGGIFFGHTSNPTYSVGDMEQELDGTMLFLGAAAFVNYYVIDPTDGLNLQGLIGYAVVDFVSAEGQSGGNDPTGPMFGLGVGYDFWVASELSIGPFARVIYAPVSAEGASATYLAPTIGAAFTYH